MDPTAIPLLQMLKSRLGYLSNRQSLVAQNVANVDTPGFKPSDLTPFSFKVAQAAQGAGAPARTQAKHLSGTLVTTSAGGARVKEKADSETTLDGNGVVLEEQMMKMAEARTNYDAAISFYQRSMGLLKLAARKPTQA